MMSLYIPERGCDTGWADYLETVEIEYRAVALFIDVSENSQTKVDKESNYKSHLHAFPIDDASLGRKLLVCIGKECSWSSPRPEEIERYKAEKESGGYPLEKGRVQAIRTAV